MLETGLSEDGAGQALGWPKVRVSARVKILELPEPAQQMIGSGVIALSAVDQLRAIGKVSSGLLDAVIAFLADGNEWAAERLAREPGWVLDSALRDGNDKAFAAYMNQASAHEISELRLGKKNEELDVEGGLRGAREPAQADPAPLLGGPADPVHGGGRRPGACCGGADRVRAGRRDHRRPAALPGARQERGEANRRAAARKGR